MIFKIHCWCQTGISKQKVTCQITRADLRKTRSFTHSTNTHVYFESILWGLSSILWDLGYGTHLCVEASMMLCSLLTWPTIQKSPVQWLKAWAQSRTVWVQIPATWASCLPFLSFSFLICKMELLPHLPLRVTLKSTWDDVYKGFRSGPGIQ